MSQELSAMLTEMHKRLSQTPREVAYKVTETGIEFFPATAVHENYVDGTLGKMMVLQADLQLLGIDIDGGSDSEGIPDD